MPEGVPMCPGAVDSIIESGTPPYGAFAEEALCAAAAAASFDAAISAFGEAAAIFIDSPEGSTSFRAVSSANGGFARLMSTFGMMVCAESQDEVVSDKVPWLLKAAAFVPCGVAAADKSCEFSTLVEQAVESLVVLDADASKGSLELVGGKLRLVGEHMGPGCCRGGV